MHKYALAEQEAIAIARISEASGSAGRNMKDKNKAILLIIVASFCFALMDVFVRAAGDLPIAEKSIFRNAVSALIAWIVLIREKNPFTWEKGNSKFLILRSVFGTIGILATYYAIDNMVLSDASILTEMSLFFGILFSRIFLKERFSASQILIVIVAFVGSIFVVKPTFSNVNLLASFIGLLGGATSGAAYTSVRKCGIRGINKSVVVLFFSLFSCITLLPIVVLNWEPMSKIQILLLAMSGLAAAGGQFSITAAYFYAPAKSISVYHLTHVIFAALLGFVIFAQLPDWWSFLGYFIIFGISIVMYFNNKKETNLLKQSKQVNRILLPLYDQHH